MSKAEPPAPLWAYLEALAAGEAPAALGGPALAVPEWAQFASAIAHGSDPMGAAARALLLPAQAWTRAPTLAVAQLLHEGSYPARMMQLDPSVLEWLGREALPLERTAIRERIDKLTSRHGVDEAIARVRNGVYLELACREVQGRPLEEVGPPLGALVGACLDAAMHAQDPTLAQEVVIFAMGKLAGDELNYLSDVDFVFVHHDDAPSGEAGPGPDDAAAQHARRMRLHASLRGLLRSLEGPAQWRPVFRVDLRLRPFGTRGPLSLSLSATERYYENHGRDWERQVWLRATPIAGDLSLGERLLKRLQPFVYRRTLGPQIFDEVEAIMRRARRESRRNRLQAAGVDLKLDRGGIREIEFFTQALQLMHAGRRPQLRSPSTLQLLDRLAAAGLLSDHEHRILANGYRWLRRVEHRVQLADGQQTHRVPEDPAALASLARRLHASGDLVLATSESLRQTLAGLRADVCEATAAFGEDEAPQQAPSQRRSWARDVVLDSGSPHALTVSALESLGLRDAQEAAALIAHIDSRPDGAWRERGPAREGATRLLVACLDSADPDAALRRLSEFSARRPGHFALWRHFAQPGSAQLVQRVADLFGASETLSAGLIGAPGSPNSGDDAALELLMAARDAELPTRAELRTAWTHHRARWPRPSPAAPPTISEGLAEPAPWPVAITRAALVAFKSAQFVRIGSHDLASRADPLHVGRALSDLADLLAGELAGACVDEPETRRHGEGLTLCAFAMGKYGMQAMDYGSDLDLFFVFDGADAKLQVHRATRVARRFLAHMQGGSARDRLYEVDMRLRPSGGQGLLVSTAAGLASYHAGGLPVWERLALLRARPIARLQIGESAPAAAPLEAGVTELLAHSCFAVERQAQAGAEAEVVTEVRKLRERIASEISRETRTQRDVKTGRGGVLEFEFMIGALQLIHGHAHPAQSRVRSSDVLHALSGLCEGGHVEPADEEPLGMSYRFMRRLLNRLRMQSGGGTARSPERFDINSPRLSALARRMGVAGAEELLGEHSRHAQRIRDAFDRYLPA